MSKATITCSTPDAVIRYTTDKTDPTESSPVYIQPVDFTDEIRARAWKDGMLESDIAVAVALEDEEVDINTLTEELFNDGDYIVGYNSDGTKFKSRYYSRIAHLTYGGLPDKVLSSNNQEEIQGVAEAILAGCNVYTVDNPSGTVSLADVIFSPYKGEMNLSTFSCTVTSASMYLMIVYYDSSFMISGECLIENPIGFNESFIVARGFGNKWI